MLNVNTLPSSEDISLDRIRADDRCQPRAAFDNELVAQYAEAMAHGAEFPAITVFFDGVDYFLADGFHRYHAAQSLGLADITAYIKDGTLRDAILHSCSANAAHGWRRTKDDKRRAILRLLNDAEWSQWSDREIARRCLVSDKTVASLRPKDTAEFPQYASRTFVHARTGQPTQMNTAAIGTAKKFHLIGEVADLIAGTSIDTPVHRNRLGSLPPNDQIAAAKRDIALSRRSERSVSVEAAASERWQDRAEPASVEAIEAVNRETGMTGAIWDIIKGIEGLPDPREAAKRFPIMLLHTLHEELLLHASAWFISFAAEIKVRKEVADVAAK